MPAVKKNALSDVYLSKVEESENFDENNDCAVKAVSIVTGVEYKDVLERMTLNGREPRTGTLMYVTFNTLRAFGFDFERVCCEDMIRKYPGRHKNLKNVTTRHPARFKEVWEDGNSYLMTTRNHICAVINGVNHDYTANSANQVIGIYRIFKR